MTAVSRDKLNFIFILFQIFYSFRDAIPVFEKLSRLSIVTDQLGSSCWKLVPLLIKNSPNLKTLVIKV